MYIIILLNNRKQCYLKVEDPSIINVLRNKAVVFVEDPNARLVLIGVEKTRRNHIRVAKLRRKYVVVNPLCHNGEIFILVSSDRLEKLMRYYTGRVTVFFEHVRPFQGQDLRLLLSMTYSEEAKRMLAREYYSRVL